MTIARMDASLVHGFRTQPYHRLGRFLKDQTLDRLHAASETDILSTFHTSDGLLTTSF